MSPPTFKTYPGIVGNGGIGSVIIQQDNASVEWDIYQISVAGPNPLTSLATATVTLNGFLVCNTLQGYQDTASGPPDVILSRGDTLAITFSGGTQGDIVNVAIWYNENTAGTGL